MKESLAHAIATICGDALATQQCNLLAPEYEVLDPNPDLHSLFQEYNRMFFEGRLAGCEVKWSKRMTLCAGLCSFQPSSGFCSIRLSEPLLRLRPRSDMVNTLLHEMIHAYVFVATPVRDHEDHGPLFQSHMNRINKAAKTFITVFHTFHDEVDSYRQHVWQCNGSCRRTPPYFGFVKRSMNRVPGPNDRWWADHERNCGGTYLKVKEPAEFTAKQAKKRKRELVRQEKKKEKEKKADPPSVKQFFSTIKEDDDCKNVRSNSPAHANSKSLLTEKKTPLSGENKKRSFQEPKKEPDDNHNSTNRPMPNGPPLVPVVFSVDDYEAAYYLVGDVKALLQTSVLQPFDPEGRKTDRQERPRRIRGQDGHTNFTGSNLSGSSTVVDLVSDDSDSEQLEKAIRLSQLTLPRTTVVESLHVDARNKEVDVIEID